MGVHLYTNGVWTDSGRIYRNSLNLFDKNTITVGKYINASGEEAASTGEGEDMLSHSDYIAIVANTAYFFKKAKQANKVGNSNAFCWFDNNKQIISRDIFDAVAAGTIIEGTATAPNNAAFLIINYRGTYLDTAMLNAGDTALPYEPYNVVDWYTNSGHGYSSGAWD